VKASAKQASDKRASFEDACEWLFVYDFFSSFLFCLFQCWNGLKPEAIFDAMVRDERITALWRRSMPTRHCMKSRPRAVDKTVNMNVWLLYAFCPSKTRCGRAFDRPSTFFGMKDWNDRRMNSLYWFTMCRTALMKLHFLMCLWKANDNINGAPLWNHHLKGQQVIYDGKEISFLLMTGLDLSK